MGGKGVGRVPGFQAPAGNCLLEAPASLTRWKLELPGQRDQALAWSQGEAGAWSRGESKILSEVR
jgi:hypothetical protein